MGQIETRRPVDAMATGLAVLLCFTWGLQQVAIKAAGPDLPPILQMSLRSFFSCLLLMLTNWLFLKEKWSPEVKWYHSVIMGSCFAGEFLCVAEALRFTTASHVAVLLYTAPLFAAVGLGLKLPEERLSRVQWMGILVAFSGIAMAFLVPAWVGGEAVSDDVVLGDAIALMSGLCWGLTTISIRVTPFSNAAPSQMLFTQLTVGTVIFTSYALLSGQTEFTMTPIAWESLLFQTLIVSFASYLLWCWMLRRYLAARLGVLAFMTPIFGVTMGVVMLDETIDHFFIIGALMVFAGIFFVQGEKLIHRFWRTLCGKH